VLEEAAGNELEPISQRDLRGSDPTVRSSGEFEAHGRRLVAAELRVLPSAVPHARLQREAAGLALVARRCKTFSLLQFFANSVAGLVRPSWKDILKIARMARRPLANKAFNSEVIRPMLMSCV